MKDNAKKVLKGIGIVFEIALLLVCSLLLIRNVCYSAIVISKTSMDPTLKDGDFGYAIKTNYALTHIKPFDIVIFKSDYDKDGVEEELIKRVIGLPGETIEFKDDDCSLYVNDKKIEQDFIDLEYQKKTGNGKYIIPSNCYFVLGDNRGVSVDSRDSRIGFVEQKQMTGILKVITATCEVNNGKVINKTPQPFVYF